MPNNIHYPNYAIINTLYFKSQDSHNYNFTTTRKQFCCPIKYPLKHNLIGTYQFYQDGLALVTSWHYQTGVPFLPRLVFAKHTHHCYQATINHHFNFKDLDPWQQRSETRQIRYLLRIIQQNQNLERRPNLATTAQTFSN